MKNMVKLLKAAIAPFLIVGLFCGFFSGCAELDKKASSGSSERGAVPVEVINKGHVFVTGKVNGEEARFILDSANGGVTLDFEFAERRGLRIRRGFVAQGGGSDSIEAGQAYNVSIDIAGHLMRELTVTTLQLGQIEAGFGRRVDGILGSELFRRYVIELDYQASSMRLHEPSTYRYLGKGESLPLELDSSNLPFIRVSVTMPEERSAEGKFLIDNAANFALVLLKSFTGTHNLIAPGLKTYTESGVSTGGRLSFQVSRGSQVGIGRSIIRRPVVLLAQDRSGSMASSEYDGLIGGEILRRFKTIYDYSRKRLILEPNSHLGDAVSNDCSGLRVRADGDGFRTFRVSGIVPDSPAAEAGLHRGDIINSVDGRPASELTLAHIRDLLREDGSERVLEVIRGTQTVRVRLRLRHLI